MEMKMMLSMPSTNSRAVRVANAIQASGEVKRSMGVGPEAMRWCELDYT
jgi:hypothetical protein